MWPSFLFPFALFLSTALGASTFGPARPPAIPLAVRSPYLSTWMDAGSDGGNGGMLAGQWPVFWANQINGWAGFIRVDGTAYTWLGAPPGPALVNQTAYSYTTTSSVFTLNVNDQVEMNVTFLSPITPDDFKRQSLVFSYLNIDVTSIDGQEHDVQIYADISAEWVSGTRTNIAQWDFGTTGNVAFHHVFRQTQHQFRETAMQAEWGDWYWATNTGNGMTFQSGSDVIVRGQFVNNGSLANTQDTNFRPINQDFPVFGFSFPLGNVGATAANTLFTIGLCQDIAIQYLTSSGTESLPSLWTSFFSSNQEAVEFFYEDYQNAASISASLDSKVASDSLRAGGEDYMVLTTLAGRQAYGATQLCGTPDKMYLFMKEISSDGNVNTVDVIFPAHPAFIYTNPTMLKLLLDPLFENQESGLYPNNYSMHDLGAHYPNATGHTDGLDEAMPLEECGNMLVMTLAYYIASKDTNYLRQHYTILKQWTGFLIEFGLFPFNQISTDDFAGALANQTNLALKGIIGIEAMSVISSLTGNHEDSRNFSNIAHSYINQWEKIAIVPGDLPHTNLAYGNETSWGLLYNLFADSELDLHLVNKKVYKDQSNWYPTVFNTFGVPLDTRHTYTKADWECFAASIASPSTAAKFYSTLANWVNTTPTNRALTDLYDTITGDYPGITFVDRPVMGGTFAKLVLDLGRTWRK